MRLCRKGVHLQGGVQGDVVGGSGNLTCGWTTAGSVQVPSLGVCEAIGLVALKKRGVGMGGSRRVTPRPWQSSSVPSKTVRVLTSSLAMAG